MISIYKDKTMTKKDELIEKVDIAFDSIVYGININEYDKLALKNIDKAAYEGNGFVITPFGRTVIQNISTGCKVLVLINHSTEIGDKIINIDECGKNVLDAVFKLDNCRVYSSFTLLPNNYDYNKIVKIYKNKKEKQIRLGDYFGGI